MSTYQELKNYFEGELESYRQSRLPTRGPLGKAVRLALAGPAKRLRPLLLLELGRLLGRDPAQLVPAALAVEMIHSSALILDDLPCMDDAHRRRGRAALHRTVGEATAILAAQGLLLEAALCLVENARQLGLDEARSLQLLRSMVETAGFQGMIAGQQKDLSPASPTLAHLKRTHAEKTALLFSTIFAWAGFLAEVPERDLEILRRAGLCLGHAFQIRDDLADWGRERGSNILEAVGQQGALGLLARYEDEFRQLLSRLPQVSPLLELLGQAGWRKMSPPRSGASWGAPGGQKGKN